MPLEKTTQFFGNINMTIGVKAILVLLLVFNLVFSFLVFRQIQIMGKKLPTPLGPLLRFISTIYVGVAAAVLLLVVGVF